MATPNYGYEKRQRELAKKRKKEEKAARKAAGLPELTDEQLAESQEPGAAEDAPAAGDSPAA